MEVTLLGTGDTIGTPRIGCACPVCREGQETGRHRLRTSFLIRNDGHAVLVDTSPDLRWQLLCSGSPHIDAVLWTHGHYDHFVGYNEFYRVQKLPPAYAAPPVLSYIREQLHFLPFEGNPRPVYTPFTLCGMTCTFVEVTHPPVYACGLIAETDRAKVVFTGDTNRDIPERSLALMRDADVLFCDALVPGSITIGKHMNYDDAAALAQTLAPREWRSVHMSHVMPWDLANAARDGETFRF
ncbi:MAG: MBL fold metallo-hydrolase [Methanomicrobiales archaeon]|nr:MBL fold metallo-hydrolase [Methanomicrobiales archaeon]